jgi:hypothetical protein
LLRAEIAFRSCVPDTSRLIRHSRIAEMGLCAIRQANGPPESSRFDIVRKGGGSKKNPSWRFRCVFYGERARNDRDLETRVERDAEGTIISRHQRENTTVRQLGCKWEGHCSFKDVGRRGTGVKGYVLTMNCDTHKGHELADDPFQFPGHLKSLDEFLEAFRQAKKHRQVILPYSDSRRLIDAEDLGIIVSARDYYNTVRKEKPDKSKPKTIVALLRMLKDNKFIYRIRVRVGSGRQK